MDIDVKAAITRLARMVDITIRGGITGAHGAKFAARHRADLDRWEAALGARIATMAEARVHGWPGADAKRHKPSPDTMLAMRLDGGVATASHDGNEWDAGAQGGPIAEHVRRVLRGEAGLRPYDAAALPRLMRDVIAADGLSPDGYETLGSCILMVDVGVDGLRRRARQGIAAMMAKDMPECLSKRGSLWTKIRFELSADPSARAGVSSVTVDTPLPDTLLSAAAGRAATDLVDHRALASRTIRRADARIGGFTIHLAEDAA